MTMDSATGGHHKVIVIGSGPAGLTAAIYAARANLQPLVIAGWAPLGQLALTTDVHDFPGVPEGIQGPDLMMLVRQQAERFGASIVDADATRVDLGQRPFRVWAEDNVWTADAVIVATGASAVPLGLPGEEEFRGRGVSACASCDAFFFRNREVALVGASDTAVEEALFLTRFASKTTVLVPGPEFAASKRVQDEVLNHDAIDVRWNTEVVDIRGDNTVTGVRVRDIEGGTESDLAVQGLFVALGYRPNASIFAEQLGVDERGYLRVVDETGSGIDGVFVAGDVHDHRYRQAVSAAGDGCKAAIDAERWLQSIGQAVAATPTNW